MLWARVLADLIVAFHACYVSFVVLGQALILAGAALDPPVRLELLGVLESDSHLFLRYGISARERVSRETTLSSSLAR